MRRRIIMSLTAALVLIAACGEESERQDDWTAELEVSDQELCEDAADLVVIDRAYVDPGPGFVDVHEDTDDMDMIGYVPIEPGETTEIEVELQRDAEDGELFHSMVHMDAAEDGVYDQDTDHPVEKDGEILMPSFEVTLVSEGEPCED